MRSLVLNVLAAVSVAALLTACVSAPKKDLALEQAKTQLQELKSDEALGGYALLALSEAEKAVRQAEAATGSENQVKTGLTWFTLPTAKSRLRAQSHNVNSWKTSLTGSKTSTARCW
jgi:hypothetical protein